MGLSGGFEMYSYVDDPNTWVDIHGLTKTYHANDKRSTKAQHGYYILDKDKNVVKVGVSSGRIKKNGKSARAEKQVRDFNNNPDKYPDGPYSSKKKTDISSQKNAREKILNWEQEHTNINESTLDRSIHKLPTPK